jgi:hypothetical protein
MTGLGPMTSGADGPTSFRYPVAREGTGHHRVARLFERFTRMDLWPSDTTARAFIDGLNRGDPVAERFVAETYHGELGARGARELVERAQDVGIDNVPEAPESMRRLFEEFEHVPDWVDPQLIERGAAVWRRWGYALGGVANAGTMDTYTEGWLAVPLSLAGGYTGQRALHRYLETTRWWLEVCRPGAILTPGSQARAISLHVRIMHVSVRARVQSHPEWDSQRWGLPISQSAMMLTLLGGSVGPGLGLTILGHLTSPSELRAVLHFNRYLGHLVGVRCDDYFPRTPLEGWQILFLCDAARSYDAGVVGKELVESFVPAFERQPEQTGRDGLRARYHFWVQAGYTGFFMLPWNRKRYEIPTPLPGMAVLLARAPLVFIHELLRRAIPAVDRRWQKSSYERWERWAVWQSAGRRAQFDASTDLRR